MTLREQLIREEGHRGDPYRDSRGFLTIGVGWNLDAHNLPDEVIDLMLTISIARVQTGLRARIPWYLGLDEPRRAVLESMAFQMGVGGLMSFRKMLAAVQVGNWREAGAEILDSNLRTQTPERTGRYAEQLITGEWV